MTSDIEKRLEWKTLNVDLECPDCEAAIEWLLPKNSKDSIPDGTRVRCINCSAKGVAAFGGVAWTE